MQAYPTLMTTSQLRLAFTTMVSCVSRSDDALAWYAIEQLTSAISLLPLSSPSPPPPPSPTDLSLVPAPLRDFSDAGPTRLDEASSLSPLETLALQLGRGHLLLTLIDQSTAVNLVLLRSLLDRIWDLVGQEPEGEPKHALIKVLFATLGQGLDATKRDEGVRYWLDRADELDP